MKGEVDTSSIQKKRNVSRNATFLEEDHVKLKIINHEVV